MIDFSLMGMIGKPSNGEGTYREKILETMRILRKTSRCNGTALVTSSNLLEERYFSSRKKVTDLVRCPANPKQ